MTEREPRGDRRRRKRGCLRKRESFSLMGQVGRFETEQAGRSGMREKGESLSHCSRTVTLAYSEHQIKTMVLENFAHLLSAFYFFNLPFFFWGIMNDFMNILTNRTSTAHFLQ